MACHLVVDYIIYYLFRVSFFIKYVLSSKNICGTRALKKILFSIIPQHCTTALRMIADPAIEIMLLILPSENLRLTAV